MHFMQGQIVCVCIYMYVRVSRVAATIPRETVHTYTMKVREGGRLREGGRARKRQKKKGR